MEFLCDVKVFLLILLINIENDCFTLFQISQSMSNQNKGLDNWRTENRSKLNSNVDLSALTVNIGNIQVPLSQLNLSSFDLKSKEKKSTWYYNLYGDVEIAEICVFSIANKCSFESSGCQRLHAKCPTHWQFHYKNHWYNMREFHSKELEEKFQDPNIEELCLVPLQPHLLDRNSKDLLKILDTHKWRADFIRMKLCHESTELNMRRLSTHSSAVSKSKMATVFDWFFKDEHDNWIKFGQTNTNGKANLVPNITSEDIEKQFCSDSTTNFHYESPEHKYDLNFQEMMQINIKTKKKRPVLRRPKKRPIKGSSITEAAADNLPSTWDSMSSNDNYLLVTLDSSSTEYQRNKKLLTDTLPHINVIKIQRIQNPYLWKAYENKKNQLINKYKNVNKVNEQRLFHGTAGKNIPLICDQNFDWRLCGSSHGYWYGKGSYFASE